MGAFEWTRLPGRPIGLLVVGSCLGMLGPRPVVAQTEPPPAGEIEKTEATPGTPMGALTPGGFRMRHSLYLLDLVQDVQAGRKPAREVRGLVGPRAFDLLVGQDVAAIRSALDDPAAAGLPGAGPVGLWERILRLASAGSPLEPEATPGPAEVRGPFPGGERGPRPVARPSHQRCRPALARGRPPLQDRLDDRLVRGPHPDSARGRPNAGGHSPGSAVGARRPGRAGGRRRSGKPRRD